MRYETIYGETFEVIKPRKCEVCEVYPTQWDYTSIYQAYQKPSDAKVAIWDYWYHFGQQDDVNERYHIGVPFITGRSCHAFTVSMNVYDIDTHAFVGVMVITRDHNRLYLA